MYLFKNFILVHITDGTQRKAGAIPLFKYREYGVCRYLRGYVFLYRYYRQFDTKSEAHFVLVPLSLPFLPVHWQNVGVTERLKTFTRLEFLLAALCRETQLQGDLCDVPGILEVELVHRQLAFFALLCLEYKVASFTRRDALRSRPDRHVRLSGIVPYSV